MIFLTKKNLILFSTLLLSANTLFAAAKTRTGLKAMGSGYMIKNNRKAPIGQNSTNSANSAVLNPTTNSSSTSSTNSSSLKTNQQPSLSGVFNINGSYGLAESSDGTRSQSIDYQLLAKYKISQSISTSLTGAYSQDLQDSKNNDFSNLSLLTTTKPEAVTSNLSLGYGLISVLPTSKAAGQNKRLLIGLGPALTYQLNPDSLIAGLSISGIFYFMRNFNQQTRAIDDSVNTQYNSKQELLINYAFNSTVSLAADFAHRNKWSYENVASDGFDFTQELDFQINSILGIGIGHVISGSQLEITGPTPNIQFVGKPESSVYASLSATF